MENGVIASFNSIKNHGIPEAGFGIRIIGTKGVIDLHMDREPFAHIRPGNPHDMSSPAADWLPFTTAGLGKPEPVRNLGHLVASHQLLVNNLISTIGTENPPLCDARQGIRTIEMIHAIMASHVKNGTSVSIPSQQRTHPFADWPPHGLTPKRTR